MDVFRTASARPRNAIGLRESAPGPSSRIARASFSRPVLAGFTKSVGVNAHPELDCCVEIIRSLRGSPGRSFDVAIITLSGAKATSRFARALANCSDGMAPTRTSRSAVDRSAIEVSSGTGLVVAIVLRKDLTHEDQSKQAAYCK